MITIKEKDKDKAGIVGEKADTTMDDKAQKTKSLHITAQKEYTSKVPT